MAGFPAEKCMARSDVSVMNTTEDPLVSVIIPAFNVEKFIAEAIDSVLSQDYPAIEIIVVDDGSTDFTRRIVESYGEKVCFLAQPNQGAAAARNRGIGVAKGFYVAFLDGDDVWARGKLKTQVRALQNSGYKMAHSGFSVWSPNSDGRYPPAAAQIAKAEEARSPDLMAKSGWLYGELLLDCLVWTSTVVVEAEELRQAGLFDVTLRKGQDYDLWLRLSRRIPVLGIQKVLALYRNNPSSITYRVMDECYEYIVLTNAIGKWGQSVPGDGAKPSAASLRRRLRKMLFNHGLAHYACGDSAIAVKSFARALIRHGFAAKPFVYLVLSISNAVVRRGR